MSVYLFKVVMEGAIGGFHGDIAISDAALSVNDNCSFVPNEARFNSIGT